jgi:ribulose-5-phosphate 4-epimerase/fuculose-1-phosphate aldolase
MQSPTRARRGAANPAQRYSAEEWDVRVNLAACYRLAAHFQMTDLIYTHFTARVPGPEHHFLINPFGMMFHEVTASSLVKLDLDGKVVEDTGYPVNEAGYIIHSAVHRVREDAHCVLHTHTQAGAAVSALQEGLLPISQYAAFYFGRIAYHAYEGLALDPGECERLAQDLGRKNILILRNHGLLTCGETVAAAFSRMLNMEKACRIQCAALAGGRALSIPPDEVNEHTARQFEAFGGREEEMEWPALLRLVAGQREDYAR